MPNTVIPAEAGIHEQSKRLDSRSPLQAHGDTLRGNNGF